MKDRNNSWTKKLKRDFNDVEPAYNLRLLAVIADNTQRIIELLEDQYQ